VVLRTPPRGRRSGSITGSRRFRTGQAKGQTGGQEEEDTLRLHADLADGSTANEATAAGQSSILYESTTPDICITPAFA